MTFQSICDVTSCFITATVCRGFSFTLNNFVQIRFLHTLNLHTSYILRYLHTYILLNYFAGYADDNAHYVLSDTIDEVIKRLETASVKLFKWFPDNQMKANRDKCYLIVSKKRIYQCILVLLKLKTPIVKNY